MTATRWSGRADPHRCGASHPARRRGSSPRDYAECRDRQSAEKPALQRAAPHNAEIGAAWSKRSEEGRDYLSLKLDDPSFNAPIYANLFDEEGGEGYTLLWSRPRKNGD